MQLPMYPGPKIVKYKSSRYNHFVQTDNGNRVAYNGVTNALAEMNAEAWQRYQEIRKSGLIDKDNQIDIHLLEGKYIIPEAMDEIGYIKHKHMQERYDSTSYSMTICPTIACNFGCDYCFENHKPGKMGLEVQNAVIELLNQKIDAGAKVFDVTWYGGEPTLAWDVVCDLSYKFISICESRGVEYRASMITNGYLLDESKVASIENLKINMLQITLDGDLDFHDQRRVLLSGKGTFKKILENIAHCVNRNFNISIRVNVDFRNKDGVHSLINRLADEGLSNAANISMYFASVGATTAPSHGVAQHCMTRKDFAMLEPEYYDHALEKGLAVLPYPPSSMGSCIAVRPDEYVIQADGEIHKCWDTVGQSQYALGNILDINSAPSETAEHQKWMSWSPFDEKLDCHSCSWLASCMGGCPYYVVKQQDTHNGEIHYDCTTFKYNSKIMLPRFANWVSNGGDIDKIRSTCEN